MLSKPHASTTKVQSVLTHVISNETDAGATVVVPRRMCALDVPASALVQVAGASHTETAKQGHVYWNVWA